MIRELMVNGAKNIPANYAAKVAMVTGMGVQVDHKAGQVKFPDAATAEGIEMVAHEFIPEGIYASQTNFDDYDKMATEIKAGVLVKRVPLYAGELYGTDQYKAADAKDTNIGKLLEVNPRYTHDYGEFVPELLEIGDTVRGILFGGDDK